MGLTMGGILFMMLAWGVIILMVVFSFARVLQIEAGKRKKGPPDPQVPNS